MSLTLGLDVLMVVLLFVAIVYAIVLDHHLSSTRENHRMLAQLIDQFYQAAGKTKDDLMKLKNAQERFRQDLQKETEKALKLKKELVFLLEAIEKKNVMTKTPSSVLYEEGRVSSLTGVMPETSASEEELLLALKDLK
ncbi:MAG: hypothetical protein IJV86_04400 [Clostridia bacterium]|nr:hypothetical protein [Clostridia bacterium]